MKAFSLLALIIFAGLCQADTKSKPDHKVVYKSIGNTKLKLHVFDPKDHKKTDKKAAIIFFFGGGWNGGTPSQFYAQADESAQKGMVAFSAEYRVKSRNKTTPFDAVEDAKSAIRWVRKNAADLGVDPDRIVASGGSAGGHVAVCTGVIKGHESKDEDLSISSMPNAMILYNPVLDTTEKGFGMSSVGKNRKTEISPVHHVREKIVPTLVLHGTDDKTVPFENADRFVKLMKKAGNHCELKTFKGEGHGFFNSKQFRTKIEDVTVYKKGMTYTFEFLTSLGYLTE